MVQVLVEALPVLHDPGRKGSPLAGQAPFSPPTDFEAAAEPAAVVLEVVPEVALEAAPVELAAESVEPEPLYPLGT